MSTTDETNIRQRSVLELSAAEAKAFFLKAESYCNLELPRYITFGPLLSKISTILDEKQLSDFQVTRPRDRDDLNHVIVNNKDGRYAWRPIKLVHPALYVSLTHTVAEESNWSDICSRFKGHSVNPNIRCLSLPVESLTDEQDKAEQILNWWWEVEQQSIELALDYEYMIQSDVADCYGSIYTHAIPWALHTKPVAKTKRNDKGLVGNLLDWHLQDMSNGQTNGIPQGSVLMDFIAELVLGYADQVLTRRLESLSVDDFRILRYRDDYRIFVNNPQNGEAILKALTEELF
jgi:RNA-directed DNA polymerase